MQSETVSSLTWQFAILAIALYKAGQIEEGLHVITATLEHAQRIDDRWWEAQRQGRETEAYHVLQPVYVWFTEGFDTADLREAKALLNSLCIAIAIPLPNSD